jgi:hypothetical protein
MSQAQVVVAEAMEKSPPVSLLDAPKAAPMLAPALAAEPVQLKTAIK